MGRRVRVKETASCGFQGARRPERLFEDMFALRRVDFTNLDMSKTVSLAWMFNNSGFGDVEIVNLKAPNAKDCERLFRLGPDVTSLKVPGLDVSGAEVAREMFASWGNRITELDLSELQLPRVKDINRMFMHCERLRRLDISNLELPPDVEMDDRGPAMFSNCVSLEHVDMPVRGALADPVRRDDETVQRGRPRRVEGKAVSACHHTRPVKALGRVSTGRLARTAALGRMRRLNVTGDENE